MTTITSATSTTTKLATTVTTWIVFVVFELGFGHYFRGLDGFFWPRISGGRRRQDILRHSRIDVWSHHLGLDAFVQPTWWMRFAVTPRTPPPAPFAFPKFWRPGDCCPAVILLYLRWGFIIVMHWTLFVSEAFGTMPFHGAPFPPSDTPPPHPLRTAMMTMAVWRYEENMPLDSRYLLLVGEELQRPQHSTTYE